MHSSLNYPRFQGGWHHGYLGEAKKEWNTNTCAWVILAFIHSLILQIPEWLLCARNSSGFQWHINEKSPCPLEYYSEESESASHSVVQLCNGMDCIVAGQAPLSMEFSRQEYWSGLPCPPMGDLPNSGIEPRYPTLQEDSLPTELPGAANKHSKPVNSKVCEKVA